MSAARSNTKGEDDQMCEGWKSRSKRGALMLPLVALLVPSLACAGDLDAARARHLASTLRAEPTDPSVDPNAPAWFVERSDNSSMRISVLSQTRYMISQRKPGFIGPSSETTFGFSNPRTRIAFDGTIVSSQFSYRFSLDFGDAELSRGRGNGPPIPGGTGTARLLDAYAQYNFAGKRDGYYVKFGQFQSIILTEEAIASEYQQVIDRSITSELYGPGYTQGIALGHISDIVAWEASLTDGGRYIGSREVDNTSFNSLAEADAGLGFRYDWKLKGSWDQFMDFASFQGSNSATKVGAGFLYQFQGQTNPGTQTPGFIGAPVDSGQIFTWTIDYQHEGDGWNFFAAYVGQWVDWEIGTATLGTRHTSIMLQNGWFITDRAEIFARFETIWLDKVFRNGFGTPEGFFHRIATVGVNYYVIPESHAAKFSADFSYAFDALFALAVGTGDSLVLPDPAVTGFLGLAANEFVFRFQLQLMF
jgi:hypothetical protein